MWLAYLIVPFLLGGALLTATGALPFGLPLILIGLALMRYRQKRPHGREQTAEGERTDSPGLGYAHEGQRPLSATDNA